MRNRELLRLAGACAFGLIASLSYSSSASAFVGLSDKQKAHIDEYIHCKILLLTDIPAFEADPACGGKPNIDLKSLGSGTGGGSKQRYEPPTCEYPTYSLTSESQYPPSCDYPE